MKFIFAITEAHTENGPFTFIPADIAAQATKILGEDAYNRIPDDKLYDVIGENSAIQFLGPTGSCLIIDTGRCFHYGSRGNNQIRCLLEIQYMSRFNCIEPSFHFSKVKANLHANQSNQLEKMILADLQTI